jgi:hypothetical protein
MVDDRNFVFHPQRGGSVQKLFAVEDIPHTTKGGGTVLQPACICRWCRAPTTQEDQKDFEEVDYQPSNYAHKLKHLPPCRVQDWLAKLKREGQTAAVVEEYDMLIDYLDDGDGREVND